MEYVCEKCGKLLNADAERLVYQVREGQSWKAKTTIDLCPDCMEKALIVLADALEYTRG